jgi:cell division protein FtsQ
MSAKATAGSGASSGRGSGARRKSPSRSTPRGGSSRKAQAAVLETLPLPAETVRRVSSWLLIAMLVAIGIAVLAALRVPQMVGVEIGEAIGRAGFTVKRVESKGLNRMNPMLVYRIAEDQLERPMPLVDLDGTRLRLLHYGWVEDARVSRRLPDTLVVDIVERRPAAIWQYNQQLSLIDRDGVVLEPVKLEAMPDLPLVIGPAANHHAGELARLLDKAPALKPIVEGATWVGGRRWDIRFHSGELLALPEGEASAARALTRFAQMDRQSQLLGRGLVRFDMRIPGKFIVRVSREPGSTVPVIADPAPPVGDAPAPAVDQGVTDTTQTI